jgi:hypothetical protein
MSRPLIVTRLHQILDAMATRLRDDRRPRVRRIPRAEMLEGRALMANIIASGVISSTASGANFNYTIQLSNSSSSYSGIGSFW